MTDRPAGREETDRQANGSGVEGAPDRPAAAPDAAPAAGGSTGPARATEATDKPAPAAADVTGPAQDSGTESPEQPRSAVEQDLNALVEEARSKADEYLDLAQRTRADFDNYRKRMAAENQAALKRGRFDVVEGLIEAIDNLERVLDATGIDRSGALENEIPDSAPIAEQGLIVAWRDLHAALGRAEVEVYSPGGEPFDPAWHEALQAIPADGVESGVVVEVLQRGYRSGETVLRPARVVVAQ